MDSKLPDLILLKLFQYLPFQERVRIGRVNRRFYLVSKIVISQTKMLDLSQTIFKSMSPGALSHLINLCSTNLEQVKLIEYFQLEAFAQSTCPRLIKLKVKFDFTLVPTSPEMEASARNILIRNGQKLQMLHWYLDIDLDFRNLILSDQLHTLKLKRCADSTLLKLTGRWPHLRHLKLLNQDWSVSKNVFDNFLSKSPSIDTLIFRYGDSIDLDRLVNFWRLGSIRELRTRYPISGDHTLIQIAGSFPQLEILSLDISNVTNRGIAALVALKNLRELVLRKYSSNQKGWYILENDIDEGVRKLADCKRLRIACFHYNITPLTMTTLIRSCPDLRQLEVHGVKGVDTSVMASSILRSFFGFVFRINLEIWLCNHSGNVKVWKSNQVDEILKELKEKGGHVIEVKMIV